MYLLKIKKINDSTYKSIIKRAHISTLTSYLYFESKINKSLSLSLCFSLILSYKKIIYEKKIKIIFFLKNEMFYLIVLRRKTKVIKKKNHNNLEDKYFLFFFLVFFFMIILLTKKK